MLRTSISCVLSLVARKRRQPKVLLRALGLVVAIMVQMHVVLTTFSVSLSEKSAFGRMSLRGLLCCSFTAVSFTALNWAARNFRS
jgi:hypothetical protein